jgi:hypothetical protein
MNEQTNSVAYSPQTKCRMNEMMKLRAKKDLKMGKGR